MQINRKKMIVQFNYIKIYSIKKTKSVLIVLLVVIMAVSLTVCGGTGDNAKGTSSLDNSATSVPSEASSTAVEKTPITLTVWNHDSPAPGIQKSMIADEIARLTGVTLNVIHGDTQKFKLLLAGNDLPEIIFSNQTSQGVSPDELLASGQLIPLDDLIEKYGENIKKYGNVKLKYSKKFLSEGQNKIYWIPTLISKMNRDNPDLNFTGYDQGFSVRWDIYAKVGHPEIKTTDDLLNVLKQMQDAYPMTPDGKKVYAISGWTDWGIWPWYVPACFEEGAVPTGNDFWQDQKTSKIRLLFNEEKFWDSIKFNNKAYRMGIVDPEAFTMKYDNFLRKAKSGQILLIYASWQQIPINQFFATTGHPDWGFEILPYSGHTYVSCLYTRDFVLGSGVAFANAITRNCKNPDRALQFIDFMNSYDAARLVFSGIKGKQWDDVDGKSVFVPSEFKKITTDSDYRRQVGIETGLKFFTGFNNNAICPDGYPADLSVTNDMKAKQALEIDKAYCEYFGDEFQFPGQVIEDMVKQGKVKTFPDLKDKLQMQVLFIQPVSGESKNILAKVYEYANVALAKAIMAKSDAEFRTEKEKMMNDIKAMGYDKVEAELLEKYEQADKEQKLFDID